MVHIPYVQTFIDVPERAYVDGSIGVHELVNVDLLRDVLVWAYERSCQRYIAIRATSAEADPVRLRYREALISMVAQIVRGLRTPEADAIRGLAASLVPAGDLERVVAMALDDLRALHEGSVARYRLRSSEYHAWRVMESDQPAQETGLTGHS